MVKELFFDTPGQGLQEVTAQVYLWEHRRRGSRRELVVRIGT